MIQLYDKLPDDFCGGGMMSMAGGDYCKAYEVQPMLNKAYAKIEFLRAPVLRESGTVPLCRELPDELGTITVYGAVYCKVQDALEIVRKLNTYIIFLSDHIPITGASAEERARHKPVKC